MILNVERSAPEHAVHFTGSMGGGGQRGTGHGGPKGRFRTRSKPYYLTDRTVRTRVGVGLNGSLASVQISMDGEGLRVEYIDYVVLSILPRRGARRH